MNNSDYNRQQRGASNGQRHDAASYNRGNYRARGGSAQRAGTRSYADSPATYRTRPTRQRRGNGSGNGGGKGKLLITIFVLFIVVLAVFGISKCVGSVSGDGGQSESGSDTQMAEQTTSADEETQDANAAYLPTPYIAQSDGITLHSAVAVNQLTEILIHNASYSYANEITTQLAEATNTTVIANHGTGRVASEQPTGDEWLTGEFIRCYRDGNAGPRMSAIDCGGPVGATVYAPVSGTVVKVKKYQLYNEYPDIQIHIQPEGREDLDVVLIHLQDTTVEEGDTVVGGVTPIASIRDVYAYIGDSMQLKDYTAEGDNGNHTHIQVNNVNDKDYHGLA